MHMTLRDWAHLILLSVLWGGAFFLVAIALREIPPLTIVLSRVSIAAIVLLIVLLLKGERLPVSRNVLLAFLIMGFLNNLVPFSLLFWAQTSISSGLASILAATTPIFSIIVAHLALADERMEANKFVGVIFGVAGVAILVGGNVWHGPDMATLGMLACVGAALSYGFASVYGRRFRSMGISSSTVALGQLSATTLMMLPIAAFVDQPWSLPAPSLNTIMSILALAVASTALAYVIFFRLLASVGAVNVALVTLLVPISAIVLGFAFLGEHLQGRHYFGMSLIAAGLAAVDGRLIRKLRKRKV